MNNTEYLGKVTYIDTFPAAWSCGGTPYGPYTALSQSSLQTAINNAETCRTSTNSGVQINIPPGLYTGSNGLTLPQTTGDASTNFIILTSTSPLPTGRTPCSHGIQDNNAEATKPGIRNVLCDGTQMSYQLATNIYTVSTGPFTLANGTPTNTSAYNDVASMWTVECTTSNCDAIQTASWDGNNVGPHHYAILNAELRPQAGLTTPAAPFAAGQGSETLLTEIPTHIHLAYSWLHGDWVDPTMTGCPSACAVTAGPTGANVLPNLVALSACNYCSLAYNYGDQALRPGAEGHAIAQLLTQQIKEVHNWWEGQSSGQLCGGQASTIGYTGFVGCTDVEDRANRYTYPFSWMLADNGGYKPNGGANSSVRKNGHENKVGERYLLDGNIVENVTDSGAQNGTVISFKTDNNSGSGNNYWVIDENTTVTNNLMRLSCNGPSFGYRSNSAGGDGNGTAYATQLELWQNNLLYGYGPAASSSWTYVPGCNGVSPQFGFRFANTGTSAVWTTGNVSCVRNSAGTIATCTLTSISSPALTVSTVNVGDPINISGCTTDSAFNTGNSTLGPPSVAGTLATGLTIVYPNVGTGSSTDATCVFNNGQGWPNYVTLNHNSDFAPTTIASAGDPASSSDGSSNPYAFARHITAQNNIFISGGFVASTFGEGTRTLTKAIDSSTLTFNNTLMAGRDPLVTCPGHNSPAVGGFVACYNFYASGTSSTPNAAYGVPLAYATGSDPTISTCGAGSAFPCAIGVFGGMSQSSFPTMLQDWHQYRLCHGSDASCSNKASLYAAGQTYQASDSTDLGVSMSSIDSAQVSTQYVCGGPCGTGPYSDVLTVQPVSNGRAVVIIQ